MRAALVSPRRVLLRGVTALPVAVLPRVVTTRARLRGVALLTLRRVALTLRAAVRLRVVRARAVAFGRVLLTRRVFVEHGLLRLRVCDWGRGSLRRDGTRRRLRSVTGGTRNGLLRVDALLRRFFLPQHAGIRYT